MKKQICWQAVYCIIFLVVIFFSAFVVLHATIRPFYAVLRGFDAKDARSSITAMESAVDDSLSGKETLVNFYGLIQRALGRRNTGGVLRDRNGMLHAIGNIPSEETLSKYADNLSELYEAATARGISFLYVQAPSDVLPATDLPLGIKDISNERIDFFLKMIEDRDISVLDTRDFLSDWEPEEVFFATDHHWTTPAAFASASAIIGRLNEDYELVIDEGGFLRDSANYKTHSYPGFLGSRGVRVGKYFSGTDTFSYLEPSFETQLTLSYYSNGETVFESEGSFSDAFIAPECLVPGYKNKYYAFMHALKGLNNESHIVNHLAGNNLRCLVVSDSFARNMAPYLGLCFSETALLDPQEGRYRESYAAFMDKFLPDVMVVMFNGLGVYTDVPVLDTKPDYLDALSLVKTEPESLYLSLLKSMTDVALKDTTQGDLLQHAFHVRHPQEIAKNSAGRNPALFFHRRQTPGR